MRLRIDTHVHSIASGHAFSTIKEIADYSNENVVELICIVDHGPSMKNAPHTGYFSMSGDVPYIIGNSCFLIGCECNILNIKGDLDLEDSILCNLDIVLAGLHEQTPYPVNTDVSYNTAALISAMKNPLIDIISHPYKKMFPVKVKDIVEAAKINHCILEVNCRVLAGNSSEEHREYRKMLELCLELGVPVVIGTDAHIIYNIGRIQVRDFEKLIMDCEKIIITEPMHLIRVLQKKRLRNKITR